MSPFILSQILVGIAIVFDILSFQFKERTKIVACLLVSCTFIATHFMILGHWTAVCLGILAALRFATSLFSTSKKVMLLFVAATIVLTAVSYNGLLSLLAGSGGCFGTVASFCKDDKRLRQLMLVGTSLWIVHNYLAGSPGAVLMEAIFIASNVVGYVRYYILPKKRTLS
jgi:Bacterial inner membrane protein